MESSSRKAMDRSNSKLIIEKIEKTKLSTDNNYKDLELAARAKLNRSLGFADPPVQVFALGKDSCAAVWWPSLPDDQEVTFWEIHRYRKDRSKSIGSNGIGRGEWLYKGFTTTNSDMTKNQIIVDNLTNDQEYRFTVKSGNTKGVSLESPPSNSVYVETPLPSGWYRFYDPKNERYYYANMRINASSWTRPEMDPWFLDESILFNFEAREIKTLKTLFKEDLAHFSKISVDQFMDILRELGERCSKTWIARLVKGYSGNIEILEWKHFMEVINHIKKSRMKSDNLISNPFEQIYLFFSKFRIKSLLKPKSEKLGPWLIEYSNLADKYYYRNSLTNETHWSMPSEVRFYIPPKLENKLLSVFDYGDIEEFQQYFALLDIDSSGDLSGKEIRLLLKSLGIEISDSKFNRLLSTIDLNGNGTIEFDEYCWMMYQLYQSDNSQSSFWKDIKMSKKINKSAVITSSNDDDSLQRKIENTRDQKSFKTMGSFAAVLHDDQDNEIEDKLSYSAIRGTLDALKMLGDRRRTGFSDGKSSKGSFRPTNTTIKTKKRFCTLCGSTDIAPIVVQPVLLNKNTSKQDLNTVLKKFDDSNLDELSLTSSSANPIGMIHERRKSQMITGGGSGILSTEELAIINAAATVFGNDEVSLYDDNDDMSLSNNKSRNMKSRRSRTTSNSSKSQKRKSKSGKQNQDDDDDTNYEDEVDEVFNSVKTNRNEEVKNQVVDHGKYCMCGCRSY